MRIRSFALIVLFGSCTLVASCQDKWEFGLLLNPGVSSLTPGTDLVDHKARPAIEFGFTASYRFNALMRVESGVSLGFYQHATRDYSPLFPADANAGFEAQPYQSHFDFENNITYAQLPVAFKVDLLQSPRGTWYCTLRLQILLQLSETAGTELVESGMPPRRDSSLPFGHGYGAVFTYGPGVGYQFDLTDNLRLSVEPFIKVSSNYAITNHRQGIYARMWSAGIRASVLW